MSIELKGTVSRITFRNNDNGYTVFKLKAEKEEITCVGCVAVIGEGDSVALTGDFTVHASYGEQFAVETAEIEAPRTQLQILKYLSSGAIKGIGPSTALKIVERFKDKSLEIIENHPQELTAIKGISMDKAVSISEQYKNQFGIKEIMFELASFNISPMEATAIFKEYGTRSVEIITENPYVLCKEGIGFSFERVEEISERFEMPIDSVGRISAGIEYVLRKNLSNGHTCLPLEKVIKVSEQLLGVNSILINDTIKKMREEYSIIIRNFDGEDFIFLFEYHSAESTAASKLFAISGCNHSLCALTEDETEHMQRKFNISFEDKQLEAVNEALKNNIFILTGRPGTGKTTTLNALIYILSLRNYSISLAAPTGRAAKRITELTGYEAKTLHRLLEVEFGKGGEQVFARNRTRPLDDDVIIVDEMSMVDSMLFNALLDACRSTTRLIFVGDSDQLPSVGAGNVLGDLLDCGYIPSVKLERIFRQDDAGDIIKNAHAVISGTVPKTDNKSDDFFFLHSSDPDYTAGLVRDLISKRLPEAYKFSPIEDIQVLCPSKKGLCGSHNLNLLLQEALNPLVKDKKQIYYKGIPFREGDKIMQIKNNYEIVWTDDQGENGTGIYNGDIGIIQSVDLKERSLSIKFDDKVAVYFEPDFEILEHAYAITVHKSQGSEFPCVIIPLIDTPAPLRYRNLIYTAITRAKKMMVMCGFDGVLTQMVNNDRKTLRYSGLKYMLIETYENN